MADDFTMRLLKKRSGYDDEVIWHKFLLDAYTGQGGFAGKVKQPETDWLPWGADAYSTTYCPGTDAATSTATTYPRTDQIDTYIDRFPREDDAKFRLRVNIAHYVNYVQPIANLYAGYLSGVQPSRQGVEDTKTIADWMQDCDGKGTPWDDLKEMVITPRAIQLGWCPVMFDADPAPEDVPIVSIAHERALGLQTRAVPLFPSNLLKWDTDDSGSLRWCKVQLRYVEQLDPLGPEVSYTKILIWTRDTVSAWRIDDGQRVATELFRDRVHKFGAVPIVVFRASQMPDDPVRGMSAIGGIAVENRRHFNLMSELDEHMRSTVFALIQVPVPPGAEPPAQLLLGNGQGVPIPSDSSQSYSFIAPPQSVADTYETRIAASVREIYRIAQAPFEQDSGVATSGIAHAYQFESTNKRLVKIGKGFAQAEQRGLKLVASSLGMQEKAVDAIRVSPPTGFLVDELSIDLDNLMKAIEIEGMAPTAKMLAILRSVQKMLPNLHADDRKRVEDELRMWRDEELKKLEPAEPAPSNPAPLPPNGADAGRQGDPSPQDQGAVDNGADPDPNQGQQAA